MPGIQQVVGVASGHGWQLDYDGFSPGRMHIRHGDTSVHIDYTATFIGHISTSADR
ncbi:MULTISPECIES: hypothetical protein [Mycobacterium]|uniref:hypothetical protein n=1 Tax=Mycobacterium TaxID=1763 RepID=UPI0013020B06|nr:MULTISPECIES: hypothetical protein [Mycobacterium]QWY65401.1 hypothetical protein BJP78_27455 [Mycobacterium avium subsp. hominissuis]